MDEPALLNAAKRLDQEALSWIFDMYAPAIYGYSFLLCQDPIESDNVVGEVFAQLLEELTGGEGPLTNLRSYIYEIAYSLLVDRVTSEPIVVKFEPVTGVRSKVEFEDHPLMENLVSSLYKDLSFAQRNVLILRYLEDFSLQETAVIVDKNVSNVKVLQNRGIAKLQRLLDFQAVDHKWKSASESDSGINKLEDP